MNVWFSIANIHKTLLITSATWAYDVLSNLIMTYKYEVCQTSGISVMFPLSFVLSRSPTECCLLITLIYLSSKRAFTILDEVIDCISSADIHQRVVMDTRRSLMNMRNSKHPRTDPWHWREIDMPFPCHQGPTSKENRVIDAKNALKFVLLCTCAIWLWYPRGFWWKAVRDSRISENKSEGEGSCDGSSWPILEDHPR